MILLKAARSLSLLVEPCSTLRTSRSFTSSCVLLDQKKQEQIPGLFAALPHQCYPAKEPSMQVDHLIIGAGIVGLAIASNLSKRYPEKSTFLVERHLGAGQETSSRNSEVIHAGLYYPADSLKTKLCLRGREMMYDRCQEWNVPFKQTGKLVVGPAESKEYLQGLQNHIGTLGPLAPPVRILSGDEAREMEPDLSKDIGWALLSERTGIVSSHELMESLEREIVDSETAELVYDTQVVRIDPHLPSQSGVAAGRKRGSDQSSEGWVVQTTTGGQSEPDAILARVVINSSGLNGHLALNALQADTRFAEGSERMGMWYSKGNYTSYKGRGVQNVKRLIYPVPAMTRGPHSHQSLGTHLTLDLSGNIKFGPDTEWLHPPSPESSVDFWKEELAPRSSDAHLKRMHESITNFLPEVTLEGLAPDYAGIRPKLIPPTAGFMDFTFLWHYSRGLEEQKLWSYAELPKDYGGPRQGRAGEVVQGGGGGKGGSMLTLAGIESPGLTSSLAIGEMVADMIAERVWGHGDAARRTTSSSSLSSSETGKGKVKGRGKGKDEVIPIAARSEQVGDPSLDAWA